MQPQQQRPRRADVIANALPTYAQLINNFSLVQSDVVTCKLSRQLRIDFGLSESPNCHKRSNSQKRVGKVRCPPSYRGVPVEDASTPQLARARVSWPGSTLLPEAVDRD